MDEELSNSPCIVAEVYGGKNEILITYVIDSNDLKGLKVYKLL